MPSPNEATTTRSGSAATTVSTSSPKSTRRPGYRIVSTVGAARRELGRQGAGELDAVGVVAPEDDHAAGRLAVLVLVVDVHDLVGDDDGGVVVAHGGAEERRRVAVRRDRGCGRRRRAHEQALLARQAATSVAVAEPTGPRIASAPSATRRLDGRLDRFVDGLVGAHRRDRPVEHAAGRGDVLEGQGQAGRLAAGQLVERGRRRAPARRASSVTAGGAASAVPTDRRVGDGRAGRATSSSSPVQPVAATRHGDEGETDERAHGRDHDAPMPTDTPASGAVVARAAVQRWSLRSSQRIATYPHSGGR